MKEVYNKISDVKEQLKGIKIKKRTVIRNRNTCLQKTEDIYEWIISQIN